MFYRNSRTKDRDITDGLSNTIAVGERTNGPILGGAPPHPNFETAWFSATRDVDAPDDDHGHMVLFDAQYTPNQAAGPGADRGVSAPHVGYAQFVYCDGSVHAITENVNPDVYDALCSRARGDIVETGP